MPISLSASRLLLTFVAAIMLTGCFVEGPRLVRASHRLHDFEWFLMCDTKSMPWTRIGAFEDCSRAEWRADPEQEGEGVYRFDGELFRIVQLETENLYVIETVNDSGTSGKAVLRTSHNGRLLHLVNFEFTAPHYADLLKSNNLEIRERDDDEYFHGTREDIVSFLMDVASKGGPTDYVYFAFNPNSELTPEQQLEKHTK